MNRDGKIIVSLFILILVIFLTTQIIQDSSPDTQISFDIDDLENTLTVTAINGSALNWKDLTLNGNGTLPLGAIKEGDVIVDCRGNISLIHTSTRKSFGTWEFSDKEKPAMEFLLDTFNKSLIVTSFVNNDESFITWSDINITFNGGSALYIPSSSDLVTVNDEISYMQGVGEICLIWRDTKETLGCWSFNFTVPEIECEQNKTAYTLTVIRAKGFGDSEWSDIKLSTYPDNLVVTMPTGSIDIGDVIVVEDTPERDSLFTVGLIWKEPIETIGFWSFNN